MEFHLLFLFLIAIFTYHFSGAIGGFEVGLSGGFEVELIHRDSPHSPLYDPLATPGERARGAILRSRAHFNQMAPKEYSVESIITMAGGEFMMTLLIGTPPLTTYALMDTASDLVWIQCLPCIQCFSQNTTFFDPKKSSTYRKVECGSPVCHSISPANCTIPSEECKYTYSYGDGSSTSGVLATESFGFQTAKRGVGLRVPKVVFGCGNDNKGLFSGGGSGIIGLGGGSLSLISQLGSTVERRFSYCLPKSAEISSTFKFGVRASFSRKVVSTPLIYNDETPSLYYVKLEGITIGGKKIATKEVDPGKANTLIDSGTTLNLLEPGLLLDVVATLRELISLPTVQDPTLTYDICYSTMSLKKISLPTFTFLFMGANIELKNLNVYTSFADITCLSMASSNHDYNIYGNEAQKNFLVEYNLENKIVSFEPAECSWKGFGGRVHSYPFITLFLSIVPVFLYLI